MKLSLLYEDLTNHAKRELKLAGLFDKDSDYGGMLGDNILELIKTFSKQGHSGMSASLALDIFNRLANYETLTQNDHSEYVIHPPEMNGGKPLWQDSRDSKWFSDDEGKTWYNIDDI